MPKLIPDPPESLEASVAPAPPASGKPFSFLRTVGGLLITGVLGFILIILGVASNAWMPSWGAAAVAFVLWTGACFLLARKGGSKYLGRAATFFAVGSSLGLIATFAGRPKPKASVEAAVATAPVAAPEVNAEPEPEPEVLSPEAREQRARGVCVGKTLENFKGVDWKFFNDMKVKPSADSMTVTIEGKRESQAYRMVCQMPDGSGPAALTLYRVDSKSKKASVETKTLEPCTTGWTDKSVCRPARPVSNAPVVRPGKRLDDAQDQCRLIARSKYPGIEWRTIMGIGSEWFELLGVHGVRTAIEGSRNGQDFRISCFLPDGAVNSEHMLLALHPITGEVMGKVDL